MHVIKITFLGKCKFVHHAYWKLLALITKIDKIMRRLLVTDRRERLNVFKNNLKIARNICKACRHELGRKSRTSYKKRHSLLSLSVIPFNGWKLREKF